MYLLFSTELDGDLNTVDKATREVSCTKISSSNTAEYWKKKIKTEKLKNNIISESNSGI